MPHRILVVDNDPQVQATVRTCLSGAGHEVTLAANGREALDAARRSRPDVILLDILMPEMGGTEVVERLRSDRRTADIPVVFMTGIVLQEDLEPGSMIAGNLFLTKPFSLQDALRMIEQALASC